MDISTLKNLIPTWSSLLMLGVKLVFIALLFELAAWFLGRKLENMADPFLNLDQNRDSKWRSARRQTLQKLPKTVLRTLLYTAAFFFVMEAVSGTFTVFSVQFMPLAFAVSGALLLIGAACLPLLRDYSQGFILLSEDTLAPGDAVEIDGKQGVVEKWTLRATWLKDNQGRVHVLSNRDVKDVTIYKKAASSEVAKPAFDPLATPATNSK